MEDTPITTWVDKFTDWLFALLIIALICSMTAVLLDLGHSARKQRIEGQSQATYQVWVKLTNRHDITYEDWRLAKKHGLLPVQNQVEK